MLLSFKLFNKYILIFLAIFLFSCFFPHSILADDEVKFNCPNLKRAISDILAKEEITISDMRKFEGQLDLSYNDITDITGLEHLINIKDLILSYNNIKDITPILGLNELKSLYINDNWIKELPDRTSNLSSLEHLDISNNEITNIPEKFIILPSLKRLYMSSLKLAEVPNLTPIKKTINRLDITNAQFHNYQFVEELYNLELLIMNDCLLTKLPDLSNMKNLAYLYLTNNFIYELPDYLSDLPLIRLDFSHNEVSSLPDSFEKLKKLEQLVFTDNYFRILPNVITKMESLQVLMCGQNILLDVPDNMSDLKNIKRASFASNELTTLEKFAEFNIPYSYQISFDLNYIDLEDEKNIEILKKYRNTGGIQKSNRLEAEVISATTDGIKISCSFDVEGFDEAIQIKEIGYYNDNGYNLISNEIDIKNNKFEIVINEISQGANNNFLLLLIFEDTTWPNHLIKYAKELNNIEVKSTPTPLISIAPKATIQPLPTETHPLENIKPVRNYLLYIFLIGVIMIILSIFLIIRRKYKFKKQ